MVELKRLRLNRTSVGLKVDPQVRAAENMGGPQSNQRGIERAERGSNSDAICSASIEPAWD